MKILVLSDSHRAMQEMRRAVRSEKPDMIIHLGDHIGDAEKLIEGFPDIPLEAVSGNCDSGLAPSEKLLEIEGKKIFICHGHGYGVKSDYLMLKYAAMEKGADVVLFGHTHVPFYDFDGRLHMMNPGSIGAARYPAKDGYGLLFIENGEIFIRLVQAGG